MTKAILVTNKARGIILPNFKICYEDTVIKIRWCWHKNRHRPIEENREPRNKPTHIQPIDLWQGLKFWGYKNAQWGKDYLFNKWCWESWILTCRMKLDPYLTSYRKIKSSGLRLSLCPKIIKLLEENVEKKLPDTGFGNEFFDVKQKHRH